MKLGIVGSSYSVGCHHNPKTGENNLALPFETWFDGIDVVNSACASKGTELYLSKILYLKKHHNIDTLLMEIINNRSMLNFKTELPAYKDIWNKKDINEIVEDVYSTSSAMYKYQRYIHQPIDYKLFGSEKEYKLWKKFQQQIAADCTANEFWGLLDIRQAIDLCEILDIKVLTWAHHWHMEQIPVFDSAISGADYIKFPGHMNALDYYIDLYGEENVLCDPAHFNDKINKEMVDDFIIPALNNMRS